MCHLLIMTCVGVYFRCIAIKVGKITLDSWKAKTTHRVKIYTQRKKRKLPSMLLMSLYWLERRSNSRKRDVLVGWTM